MNPTGRHDDPLDTREVAGKGKRSRRKRTTTATTARRVNAKAQERHAAWAEGGRPLTTYQLTRELNGREDSMRPEGLLAEHRQAQAGTFTDPYRGRTWRPQ